jgi:hypothetical protein
MAAIQNTQKGVPGAINPAQVTLGTSGDTLSYVANASQELILTNTSVSAVVVTIDGAGGTTIAVPGTGGAVFSVASGYAVTVPASGMSVVQLDSISSFLQGVVAISAATGAVVKAAIIQ